MKVSQAVAEILKREGVEFLIGYPVNPDYRGGGGGHPHDHRRLRAWAAAVLCRRPIERQARDVLKVAHVAREQRQVVLDGGGSDQQVEVADLLTQLARQPAANDGEALG